MHELRARAADQGKRIFRLEEGTPPRGRRGRGWLIGNQFGGGSGKTVLTVVGALGGAFTGHTVEEKHRDKIYEVAVRMDDGRRTHRHLPEPTAGARGRSGAPAQRAARAGGALKEEVGA